MKRRLTLAVALVVVASPVGAQRAKSPADAAVFIRLVGSVHAEIEEAGLKRSVDVDHVEVGSGSGFVISPYGYVLTNEHVVSNSEPFLVSNGLQQAKVTLKVSRIDVCFPPEAVAARPLPSSCSEASVTASDPTLDLAVLLISGSNLPYIPLGDSDAVMAGLPVDALGYPFGRDVDVGRVATAPDLVPEVSVSPGVVSALRADDAGQRRYLQITNIVNPGNSGGPIVDRDGFALGVIRMKLAKASGIGFAIAVNEVKNFLEARGLDQLMPGRRLRLGGFQSIEAKGIGLRWPEGIADISPFRSRLETDTPAADIRLRIDRVLSPWNPRQIEEALIGTQTFEPLSMVRREGRISPRSGDPPLLLGAAAGTPVDSNQEIRMDYAVLDLGPEKLVARYVGPAESMAFNEGVLRQSLYSLQGQRLIAGGFIPAEKLEWFSTPLSENRQSLALPSGWIVEPGGPTTCPGLPQPSTTSTAFAANDFTVVLRAAVWSAGDVVPDAAASACSSRRGSLGGASYTSRAVWLGVSYLIEGTFARVGPREVVQLEVLSTDQKSAGARALLAVWLRKATE
ncbi:MAG: S1C family serine protease [Vicinamibacterales bacterium]